jgi:hypothetical protein
MVRWCDVGPMERRRREGMVVESDLCHWVGGGQRSLPRRPMPKETVRFWHCVNRNECEARVPTGMVPGADLCRRG